MGENALAPKVLASLENKSQNKFLQNTPSQNISSQNTPSHNTPSHNNISEYKPKSKAKSRKGCVTCKSKRLKCDESKPYCQNCQKKKIMCGGYATRFKWRFFNDGKETAPGDLDDHTLSTTKSAHRSSQRDMFKQESPVEGTLHSETTPLSLKDHIELASLSVVGKSTKDMKRENELMSKGINPETHISEEPKRKLRRSYSSAEISQEIPVVNKKRANSSSHSATAPSIQSFRNDFHDLHGLHSLAESAVNELRSRSPGSKPTVLPIPPTLSSPEDTNTSKHRDFEPAKHSSLLEERSFSPKGHSFSTKNHSFLPKNHSFSPKNHSFSPKNHSFSPDLNSFSPTQHQLDAPSKEWPFPRLISPSGIQEKESLADLNLTPSLSALITHAFSRDDKTDADGDMGFGFPDAALSPLDINFNPHPHDSSGQSVKQNALFLADEEDLPNDSRAFLDEVNTQLMKHEDFSPSIINGTSSVRLSDTSEQDQILFLFSKYTCGIMSIKSGSLENPWRNIYIPLAKRYSFFFNSIASMTLFHLAGNSHLQEQSKALRANGFFYMKKCIVELVAGLSRMEKSDSCDNQLPADIALATCLNLTVSETWDTHTSSGIAHLKGAKSMIQKILDIIKQFSLAGRSGVKNDVSEESLKKKLVLVRSDEWQKIKDSQMVENGCETALYIPRKISLLFNEWIYFEVLSQMTSYSGQDDKGIDLVATITKITSIHQKQKGDQRLTKGSVDESPAESVNSSRSNSRSNDGQYTFFENLDSILQNNDYIDPLLGCAQSLFSVMGKVSNLISKVRKAQETGKQTRNSLKNISLASELKKQLVDWKPNVGGNLEQMVEDNSGESSWDIYSCVSTAEAYRYATLLYLHEAVPEVPSMTSYQLAEKVFVSLASIPSNSNLYIIHIFPLLISSCEAESKEEREWCEARWGLLVQRLWIGNIDRAFEVVKEVWRRKDEYKREQRRDKELEEGACKDREEGCSISTHLEEVIKNMHKGSSRDDKSIISRLHWSSVMREWGWEVLLA